MHTSQIKQNKINNNIQENTHSRIKNQHMRYKLF
jgi:hypothetical protein